MIRHLTIATFLLLMLSYCSSAQDFVKNAGRSGVDSLLDSRVDFWKESISLFHCLTNYRFYEFDEVNEFKKQEQMKQLDSVCNSFKNGWRSRYMISFPPGSVWNDSTYETFLQLDDFDFNSNSFPVRIRDFQPQQLGEVNATALDSVINGRTPNGAVACASCYLSVKIDPAQNKPRSIKLQPDSAETFKSLVEDKRVSCDVALQIINNPRMNATVTETPDYSSFKKEKLEEFKKSGGFVKVFNKDGPPSKKPHPFSKLTPKQRENEIIKEFKELHPQTCTHFVNCSFDIVCKIEAIRILADDKKMFEWRIK